MPIYFGEEVPINIHDIAFYPIHDEGNVPFNDQPNVVLPIMVDFLRKPISYQES